MKERSRGKCQGRGKQRGGYREGREEEGTGRGGKRKVQGGEGREGKGTNRQTEGTIVVEYMNRVEEANETFSLPAAAREISLVASRSLAAFPGLPGHYFALPNSTPFPLIIALLLSASLSTGLSFCNQGRNFVPAVIFVN
ncbi:hypothetical protein Pcinc_023113 [Petrolisthes cinctipes]|uniref:Uncharacterized protein n=1 Tax=Petrolisthes cinctipes TaxID=88211 RepID=A0AAE1FD76_PETCI|nr:hypothetical protein Pcinc_023113 [Petrolisthes cinctipes]